MANDLENETWRDIKHYKGRYQVSNLGRIKSLARKRKVVRKSGSHTARVKEIICKPWTRKNYLIVKLCKEGDEKSRSVHRLVLEAFVGPAPKNKEARHLNGLSKDNRLVNLKWGTAKENTLDKFKHGTQVSKLTEIQILEIRKQHACGDVTHAFLAKKFDVYRGHIGKIVNKKIWKHVGGK